MAEPRSATARHDLLGGVRDVLKAVRVFKSHQPPRHTVVPAGTFGILAAITDIGPVTGCHSKDLAARCALDPSTISRAVAALVRAGLVARVADPDDGRASVLLPTPEGRAALDDITGWYDDRLAEALRDWTEDDLAALATLLRRFSGDLLARFDDRHPADGQTTSRNPTDLEAAR